jgi:hypothetical protein
MYYQGFYTANTDFTLSLVVWNDGVMIPVLDIHCDQAALGLMI